jgi:hypothetical protein
MNEPPSHSPVQTPQRPRIYNRLWHMDADDRRHHGRRRWESEALEAIVGLAAEVDQVYPPDWSDEAVVRFRASGRPQPVAEIRTDHPDHLVLSMHGSSIDIRRCSQIDLAAVRAAFASCLKRNP